MRPVEDRLAGATGIPIERIHRALPPAGLLVLCLVAGVAAPGTWPFAATFAVIQALLALSVGMLFARAGLLSLCPLAFAALSAWVVLWFNTNLKLPFAVMLVIGTAAAVPAGVLVGGLALRLRGVNLAVVTLAFAVAVTGVLNRFPFPGTLDPVFRPVRPIGFSSDRAWFLLCFAVLVAVGIGLEALGRTRTGQAWLAVRASERATAAAGLSVPNVKLSAFVVSAAIAGLAGGLTAGQLQGSVDIRSFNAILALAVVAAAVMFGAGNLSGAVVAGALAALVPEVFRRIGWAVDYPQMAFGVGAVHALSRGGGGISATFPWRVPRRSTAAPPRSTPLPPLPDPVDTSPPDAVLELRELTVVYGSLTALDHVDLVVPGRSVVGIIGPNGAGKSTLIDAVCGFVSGYSGSVALYGLPIDGLAATGRARAGLRRTFQQGGAVAELTVGDYVRLHSRRPLGDRELDDVLGFFGLPPADEPIRFVDVGTRRVVEVAACVASRPVVAFLDEPAAGLGAGETAALTTRIAEIPARFDCAVVLIEHDVELVAAACSRISVLEFGRVIAEGPPGVVLADDRVKAAYLGVAPDDLDLDLDAPATDGAGPGDGETRDSGTRDSGTRDGQAAPAAAADGVGIGDRAEEAGHG